MYSLTITNPNSESLQIKLTSGKMVLGRAVDCNIVINDASASRRHAEIFYDSMTELVTINDLKSSNGTYVNRQRITRMSRLQSGDVIRIGETVIYLTKITDTVTDRKGITGTHLFTRELVLEAVDEHPIPLNEITEELNTVVDIDSAIRLVMDLIKPGASCPEIYRKFLEKFSQLGFEPISFVAHGIGLHLHEEPYMGRYGNEIVEDGMVGAFEPLVYIPGRFGMQNKDMFCVTNQGCELLSDVTPTDTLLRVG